MVSTMKNKFLIGLLVTVILLIGFASPSPLEKHIVPQLSETRILKVAGDNNFPPYEYVDENGNYTGFNVDIMRAIALQSGVELQFYPMNWHEACEKLKLGEIDVIEGMKITKDRELYYDFSREYLENSQSIFVSTHNDKIDIFQSLSGSKVAVQQGDVVLPELRQLTGINIYLSKDQQHAMQRLLNLEVDAYIGNTLAGVFLMNQMGARSKIKMVGETLNPTKYAIAVKKGDTETLQLLDNSLVEIKKNGTYDRIYRKWFGQPTQLPSWYIRRFLLGASFAALCSLIALLIFYRWNYMLKKEVYRQTRHIQEANENLIQKNMLIQEERDFRSKILNEIFSGIVTINQKGVITFANQQAHHILRMKKHGLINQHYHDTSIRLILDIQSLPKDHQEKELSIEHEKIILNYKISLLHSIDPEQEEIILTFRDVTEERWMQENIKTKDKLQSLGNLISGIAHEIRNPLTAIKTYAELIPKKFDNPKFRVMVSKDIPQEIDRLNALINDLLEYSRPRKPFKEKLSLWDAIHGVTQLLHNKLQRESIRVINNIPKNVHVYMDKNHLRQVLINILLNAVESIDQGEKRIIIDLKETPQHILLSIQDNGCGIDEESFHKIYNPFYTTKSTGTGLGLFVCYQLLVENQAEIMVHSMKNEGTTFTIQFKRPEEDQFGEVVNC